VAGGIQLVADGWRLGGWWLGGDSWWLQVMVVFLDLLDGLSLIQQVILIREQQLKVAVCISTHVIILKSAT
jgi:hypothetical protein